MHNKIKRAIGADRIMTVVFYCVAVFFFVLLAAFAGYVIIKGFMGATPGDVQVSTPRKYRKPVI